VLDAFKAFGERHYPKAPVKAKKLSRTPKR
jgi:hypothetical protein